MGLIRGVFPKCAVVALNVFDSLRHTTAQCCPYYPIRAHTEGAKFPNYLELTGWSLQRDNFRAVRLAVTA